MIHFLIRYFLIMGCIAWQGMSVAATTVTVDPTHITLNKPFHLTISADDTNVTHIPNLTPLQNEFTILGTEHRVSYSLINGQTTTISQWVILLRPKKTGQLVIPSLNMGHEQTDAMAIDVLQDAPPSATPTENVLNDIMLKTNVSEMQPYVNQQVIYTVKLFNSRRLLGAEYHPPRVENALLIPLGEGSHHQTQLNGIDYGVEEQQYAIFPQKSGEIILHPPSFNAAIDDGFPRQIAIEGDEITLGVKPSPTDIKGIHWLPAQKVTLMETLDLPKSPLKQGDTFTRTVTVKAVAMPAQLLPSLFFKATDQFNVYPESPDIKNTVQHDQLIGRSTFNVTYLLNQSGQITLPQLDFPWFNTSTGKTEITSLPPHVLTVQSNGKTTALNTAPSQTALTTGGKTLSKNSPESSLQTSKMAWTFAIGFMAALSIGLLLGWLRKSLFSTKNQKDRFILKRFENACRKNRPLLARTALLCWAKQQWPESSILNLHDVAVLTRNAPLKQQIRLLSESLYGLTHQRAWQGHELWESFKLYLQLNPLKKSHHTVLKSALPPLNP